MKRILIYIMILAAVTLIPLERTDVGKLRPVETVSITREGGAYVIATDTGDEGRGADPVQALQDLIQTTPGVIYLDTARFILVGKDAEDSLVTLRPYLSGSAKLFSVRGMPDLESASRYLQIHGNGPKLKAWKSGVKLPVFASNDNNFRAL